MKRLPFLTVLLSALAIVVHLSPTLTLAWQHERDLIFRGEPWRLLTGHFTHFGRDHLTWDLLAFLLFGSLVERRSRGAWTVCLVAGSLVISLGVATLQPHFSHYRGLSGLDSAFFTCLAVGYLRAGRQAGDRPLVGLASAACVGLVAKTLFETVAGQTVFVEPDARFEPVPLAHLLGAAIGAIAAGLAPVHPRNRRAPVPATAQAAAPP